MTAPEAIDARAEDALRAARESGLEGIVAKRLTSPYRSGARSDDWRKFPVADTTEAVVIGWRESEADPDGFASLLLATRGDDGLRYAGRVASGFTARERTRVRAELSRRERKTPPVAVPTRDRAGAHWVTPSRVVEVSSRERTDEGRFRHPVWRGFRPDKSVDDLT